MLVEPITMNYLKRNLSSGWKGGSAYSPSIKTPAGLDDIIRCRLNTEFGIIPWITSVRRWGCLSPPHASLTISPTLDLTFNSFSGAETERTLHHGDRMKTGHSLMTNTLFLKTPETLGWNTTLHAAHARHWQRQTKQRDWTNAKLSQWWWLLSSQISCQNTDLKNF